MTAPAVLTSPAEAPKVAQRHLSRRALVYVRQSTLRQVEENSESTRLQYALTERAVGLGWAPSMVGVIDSDLGRSGRSMVGREGFVQLVGEVGLGRVGLVLSRDVSRLSRSLADWGQLLDLCGRTDTLIADAESVYDLSRYADRFLLGVLGTVSESELHTLRMRMHAGREAKAARGELAVPLPRGYVRADDGRVEMDPDEEVRASVRLVFDLFAACGSLTGMLKLMAQRGVRLPHRSALRETRGALVWGRPSLATLHGMLRSPVYAGAFVWGRNKPDGSGAHSWRHLIRDHHPAYIGWDAFELNQNQLAANVFAPRSGSRGNLLSGLVRCGRCGQRMGVHYSSAGTVRLTCPGEARDYGGDKCQSFAARLLEPLVSRLVLEALSPAALELSRSVAANAERDREEQHRTWGRRIERAGQEAERIFRQYDAVEPENRMVARSIEARYEAALAERHRLDDEYERFRSSVPERLSETDWERIRGATEDIARLWNGGGIDDGVRASVLSLMIERIVVTQDGSSERIAVEIHWHGGQVTAHRLRAPVRRLEQLTSFEDLGKRVLELESEGKTQQEIADCLNAEGYRPPRRARFSVGSVSNLLNKCRTPTKGSPHPWRPPTDRKPDEWTIAEFADLLGMPVPTVYNWVTTGVVSARRSDGSARWLILADDTEVARLKERREAAAQRTEARRKAWDEVVGNRY